jgi:hypothetical protein
MSKFFNILLLLKQLSDYFLCGGRVVFFRLLLFTPFNSNLSGLLLLFSGNLRLDLLLICCTAFLLFVLPRSSLNQTGFVHDSCK